MNKKPYDCEIQDYAAARHRLMDALIQTGSHFTDCCAIGEYRGRMLCFRLFAPPEAKGEIERVAKTELRDPPTYLGM